MVRYLLEKNGEILNDHSGKAVVRKQNEVMEEVERSLILDHCTSVPSGEKIISSRHL